MKKIKYYKNIENDKFDFLISFETEELFNNFITKNNHTNSIKKNNIDNIVCKVNKDYFYLPIKDNKIDLLKSRKVSKTFINFEKLIVLKNFSI
ncbi:hypothetical protein [Spiroplasma endosymbiont of Atherix ibis]|uniref:hypothetical protein n=1 Tax=Spiroplasma endosymbiont of Atherix ibis TaxID=3066291 RepID=UPI0030D61331